MMPHHKSSAFLKNEKTQSQLLVNFSAVFKDSGIIISRANIDDKEALSELCKETYRQTYPNLFTETDLDSMFNIKDLSLELLNEAKCYFIAKDQHRIIGYAKIEFENNVAHLSKLYLLSEAQGKGVGKSLLKSCCEEMITVKRDSSVIKLDVWENNKKAIEFYERLGFQKGDKNPISFNGQIFYDYRMEHTPQNLLAQLNKFNSDATTTPLKSVLA